MVKARYGNLFHMYEKITAEDPYEVPMRIYPAVHYTMGGLWVDYNLMTTVPGLYALGEANFSDHGANRLGASALMQGLADGYFVMPYTLGNYLAQQGEMDAARKVGTDHPAFDQAEGEVRDRVERLMAVGGAQSVESFHKRARPHHVEPVRHGPHRRGPAPGPRRDPQAARGVLARRARARRRRPSTNPEVEKAARVADFLEFGELMCRDALHREESCGGHFREEHQSAEGEAARDDEHFAYVGVWEFTGARCAEPELSQGGARVRERAS